MNKILRYSFVALLAMMFGNVMAQNVILDFSLETEEGSKLSAWGLPASSKNKTVEEKEFTYGDYTIMVAGSANEGYYWHDKDKYLLLGKTGAYIILPAFDFDVEAIKVYGREGASGKVTHNIFVGEEAVSTEIKGATTTSIFNIAEGKQAAGTIYKFKVTNNNNDQIVKIEICKKGSGTKEAAGLSWGTGSKTVTIGADDNVFPELTNPHNVAVTYESSKPEFATIAADGTITLVAAGTTQISAIFAGDDTYEAQTVSYNLTVKEAPVYKNFVKATTIESGKNYLLVVNLGEDGLKAAKKIGSSYGNLSVDAATETEGKISFVIDNAFTFTSTENGWTIMQSDGKYLYQSGDYNNFNVNAAPTSGQYFDVEAQEDGTFKITNKEKSKFIQYVPANKNIGCFAEAQEGAILPMLYVEEAKYTITITNTEHGNITLDKYEAAAGEKVSVTGQTTDDGWDMDEPTITAENGETVTIGGDDEEGHYIIMPASNITIALNISKLYTITTVFNSEQGDVTGITFNSEHNPIYKKAGKNIQFTVTAKEGFEVKSVTAADADNTSITVNVAADKSYYEFEMPAKDVIITATFATATGISAVAAAKAENAVRYNLAGQKVNAGYKGVVIMNGKKMLQK